MHSHDRTSAITSAIKVFCAFLQFPSISLDFLYEIGDARNKDGPVRGLANQINGFDSTSRKQPCKVS